MGRMEGRPVKPSRSQLSYPAKPPSTRQSSPESAHLPGKPTLRQDLPGKGPVAPRVTSSAWGPETLQA